MSSLPLTADELTTNWLNQALATQLGGASIVSFDKEIIGVGEGFLGQLARVTLSLDVDNPDMPTSIVAKFASTKKETREFAKEQNYYGREIGFYHDIGHEVGIPIPDCYYAEHLPETNHFVILLEDLAPAVASDQVQGTGVADSQKVIETFALLHAKWWNSERLSGYEWAQPLMTSMPISEGLEMLNYSIKQAEETGRFDRYPEMKKLIYMLPPLFKMEPPPPYPYTLNHGDLRSDNIFFPGSSGGEFAVIDWQLAGMGQPMTDISRWLTQSITIEQRRATEKDLLKLYHDRLLEHGITGYSYRQMMQDYQLNLVVLLLMFSMTMENIDQTGERAEAFFHEIYSRLDAALVDWKVVNILRILPFMVPFLKLSVWLKMKLKR